MTEKLIRISWRVEQGTFGMRKTPEEERSSRDLTRKTEVSGESLVLTVWPAGVVTTSRESPILLVVVISRESVVSVGLVVVILVLLHQTLLEIESRI